MGIRHDGSENLGSSAAFIESLFQTLKSTTESRLEKQKAWWALRSNFRAQEAWSCRQAATVRDRLGSGEYGGIPLWCEVKSEIGRVKNLRTSVTKFYAAHTRANTRFDEVLIKRALGWALEDCAISKLLEDVEGTAAEEYKKSDADFFGLVNPFNIDVLLQATGNDVSSADIVQLFDESLTLAAGSPDTVMTNAGSRTIAFEMNPRDLINAISKEFPNTVVETICGPDQIWLGLEGKYRKDEWLRFPPPSGPNIGILTGNSPESGLTLWQDILGIYRTLYETRATDVLMPNILVHSLPEMGVSMELVEREAYVWDSMKIAIEHMLRSGCKLLTVACNTTIHFEPRIEELCESYEAEFVSIAEACISVITKSLIETNSARRAVGLVGIGPVIDIQRGFSGYAKHMVKNDIEVIPCDGEEIAYLMKNIGGMDKDKAKKAVTKFRNLINERLQNVEVVVLALTEVSIAYRLHIENLPKNRKSNKLFIDPLYELAAHLILLYLKGGLSSFEVCQIPRNFRFDEQLSERVSLASKAYRTHSPEAYEKDVTKP